MLNNILITTSGLSSVGQGGGISSYVHDLAENLSLHGHKVTVYLLKEGEVRNPVDINYSYKLFRIPEKIKDEENVIIKLYDSIKELKPDVIINNDTAYISGLWPVLDSSIIKISVMHGFTAQKFPLSNSGIQGKIATINHEYIDYIVCQNKKMVNDTSQKYNIPLEKLLVIPQTVSLKKQYNAHKEEVFNIVFAGGANKRKGAEEAFKICKQLKNSNRKFILNWCLPASKYEKYFKEDKRFNFLGQLNRDKFLEVIAKSDCILIPTHMDTGPMLLVESMAMGTTPICNNLKASAIPDIVKHNWNGILIEKNKPELFVKVIMELMDDREKNTRIAQNALNYFNEQLSVPHQIQRFEQLFNKKNSTMKKVDFSADNIVFDHLKTTSHLPKYSLKRIFYKIISTLEIPLSKNNYWYFVFSKII